MVILTKEEVGLRNLLKELQKIKDAQHNLLYFFGKGREGYLDKGLCNILGYIEGALKTELRDLIRSMFKKGQVACISYPVVKVGYYTNSSSFSRCLFGVLPKTLLKQYRENRLKFLDMCIEECKLELSKLKKD